MASTRQRGNRFVGLYRDEHGKQKSAGTYDTADEALARAKIAEIESRPAPEPEILYRSEKRGVPTIAAYGPLAIAGAKLESTSRETYSYLFGHVKKEFGAKALDELSPAMVRAFARKLDAAVEADDMASSTTCHIFGVLKLIYATAAQDFPEIKDPTKGISVSRKGGREKIIATRRQAKLIEELIFPRYRLLAKTLFATGLRYGEAMALKSTDVVQKLNGRWVLKIRRSVAEVDGQPVERKYGKTSCAQRDVPVSEALAEELTGAAGKDGRIFRNTRGGYIRRSNFHGTWGLAARAAGVPGLTPHGARHSLASWLANDPAVPLVRVRDMLGHSSLTQTSAYVHTPDDEDDTILAALEEAA